MKTKIDAKVNGTAAMLGTSQSAAGVSPIVLEQLSATRSKLYFIDNQMFFSSGTVCFDVSYVVFIEFAARFYIPLSFQFDAKLLRVGIV